MDEVRMASRAWEAIESAVLATNANVETGGLLVGTRSQKVIVAATKPGPGAEQKAYRFTDDPDHQQAELDAISSGFDEKVSVEGWWHSHLGMAHPSGGDFHQARELVEQFGRRLLVLIACVQNHRHGHDPCVTLNAFTLQPGDTDFRSVRLLRVPDDSPLITDALAQEPSPAPIAEKDFWKDLDFNFYLTPVGHDRIQDEIAELRAAGFRVTSLRRKRDGRLLLEIGSRGGRLLCLPPREYPVNPPRLFWPGREKPIWLLRSVLSWNSDSRILDVVNEAFSLARLYMDVFDIPRLVWRRLPRLRPRL